MATSSRMWVKTWRVVVNNSGHSNMSSVVGRYMTPEAAERVAQAFRDALYADPYNYWTETRFNRETKDIETVTYPHVDVRVEEDGFNSMLGHDAIRLAQQAGIVVRDENGHPISKNGGRR